MTSLEKLHRLQEALRMVLDVRKASPALPIGLYTYDIDQCVTRLENLIVAVKVEMKGDK